MFIFHYNIIFPPQNIYKQLNKQLHYVYNTYSVYINLLHIILYKCFAMGKLSKTLMCPLTLDI